MRAVLQATSIHGGLHLALYVMTLVEFSFAAGFASWGVYILPLKCRACIVKDVFSLRLAGTLLRSATFPVPLHCVLLGPAEHALYAGGADGRIFELPLAGQPVPVAIGAGNENACEGLLAAGDVGGRGWAALEGHTRTVTCLEATTDGGYMLSGGNDVLVTKDVCR